MKSLRLEKTRVARERGIIRGWEERAEAIEALRMRAVDEGDLEAILKPYRGELDKTLERVYLSGAYNDADAALLAHDANLLRAAQVYCTKKRREAGDGLADLTAQFADTRYHDLEIGGLRALLNGERVQVIGWLSVTTNAGRRIEREAMREAAIPVEVSNMAAYNRQFIRLGARSHEICRAIRPHELGRTAA